MAVLALVAMLAGCEGPLPAPERTPRRAIESPTIQGTSESEVLGEGPHPFIVGELPEKKGQTLQVHTALEVVLPPTTTRPTSRPATQPAEAVGEPEPAAQQPNR